DAGTAAACGSSGLYFPITTSFTEGRLYWLTTINNLSTYAVQIRQGWHFPAVFGFSSDLNCWQATIAASYAFGTMPTPFPASACVLRQCPAQPAPAADARRYRLGGH